MFPAERQVKLDKVLAGLRELPGVLEVQQDDFNSNSVNVFVVLSRESKPMQLPVRSVKAGIKRVCRQLRPVEVGFNFLGWPEMQYSSESFQGHSWKCKEGYNTGDVKIEVFV